MNKHKAVSPVVLWLVIIVGGIMLVVSTPDGKFFNSNIFTSFLFLLSIVYWFSFFNKAIKINRKAVYSADKIDELIQKGVYGVVRHPIYGADIILFWGIFVSWPYLRTFMVALWATLMLLFWMKVEEIALVQKFGDVYDNYKKQVPMVIPKFWKKKT
ncbi:methyltransferase family protein [Patescibacteria group bacterium]